MTVNLSLPQTPVEIDWPYPDKRLSQKDAAPDLYPPPLPRQITREQVTQIAEDAINSFAPELARTLGRNTYTHVRAAVIRSRRDGTGTEGVLRDIAPLFDKARALRVATTETTRLMGLGAQAVYVATGVEAWQWMTVRDAFVCPICDARSGKKYPMDVLFSPAHVNCRCFNAPAEADDEPTYEELVQQAADAEAATREELRQARAWGENTGADWADPTPVEPSPELMFRLAEHPEFLPSSMRRLPFVERLSGITEYLKSAWEEANEIAEYSERILGEGGIRGVFVPGSGEGEGGAEELLSAIEEAVAEVGGDGEATPLSSVANALQSLLRLSGATSAAPVTHGSPVGAAGPIAAVLEPLTRPVVVPDADFDAFVRSTVPGTRIDLSLVSFAPPPPPLVPVPPPGNHLALLSLSGTTIVINGVSREMVTGGSFTVAAQRRSDTAPHVTVELRQDAVFDPMTASSVPVPAEKARRRVYRRWRWSLLVRGSLAQATRGTLRLAYGSAVKGNPNHDPASGQFSSGGGVVGGGGGKASDKYPAPGTVPIPEGHVRLFHYTRAENETSIREHGLRISDAQGSLSQEPNAVWAMEGLSVADVKEFVGHTDPSLASAADEWLAFQGAEKYRADQPRDRKGQFSSAGSHANPEHVARGQAVMLHHQLIADGGFSYQPRTHLSPRTGMMLSTVHKERIIEGGLKVEDIRSYLTDNADLFKVKSNYVGGWLDTETGKTYLDVSQRVSTHREAKRLSLEHKQEAYYDVAKGESVYIHARDKFWWGVAGQFRQGEAVQARPLSAGDERRGDSGGHRPDEHAVAASEKGSGNPNHAKDGKFTTGSGGDSAVSGLSAEDSALLATAPHVPGFRTSLVKQDWRSRATEFGQNPDELSSEKRDIFKEAFPEKTIIKYEGEVKGQSVSEKYNPNHDPGSGQFSSGSGTGAANDANTKFLRARNGVASAARRNEPQITSDMVSAVGVNGGTMAGLEFRLKEPKSLGRKIKSDAADKGITHEEAASRIGDALRYTGIFDEAHYSAGTKSTLATLEARGYRVVAQKNYWATGGGYRGVNTNLVHSVTGQKMELQFHTPKSIDVKEHKAHPLYVRARKASTPPALRLKLNQEMLALWDSVPEPAGVESICCPVGE